MITVQESMVNIELSGELGKRFGKKHKRLVATTNEAIQALCCTISGFEMFMNKAKERGLTFAIFKNGKNIGLNDFSYPVNDETIKIVPVAIGSKKAGVLQTILGAVIIAAAVMLGPAGAGALAAGTAWNVGLAGGAMMLGGVVQMLSPQPAGLARKESADNKASYAFGGVTNTASQGYPVPLLYGKRRIGGAIISAGIYVEDQQ
ncbi:TPA: tail assembly protein [Klebsiella pneumoniae]|nr:tail assembly protein [Klebsiella pneumoniae]HEE1399076.1 tail assembly protein [Klebsiella pneumoniae]